MILYYTTSICDLIKRESEKAHRVRSEVFIAKVGGLRKMRQITWCMETVYRVEFPTPQRGFTCCLLPFVSNNYNAYGYSILTTHCSKWTYFIIKFGLLVM